MQHHHSNAGTATITADAWTIMDPTMAPTTILHLPITTVAVHPPITMEAAAIMAAATIGSGRESDAEESGE